MSAKSIIPEGSFIFFYILKHRKVLFDAWRRVSQNPCMSGDLIQKPYPRVGNDFHIVQFGDESRSGIVGSLWDGFVGIEDGGMFRDHTIDLSPRLHLFTELIVVCIP